MVSRTREVAEITRAFSQHRLVTLHGQGGVGKTWLAKVFSPDSAVVVATEHVAADVGEPGELLVLDGAERALDACAELVGELLGGNAQLRILVTSTEVLDVRGERVLSVTPFDESSIELVAAVPRDHARLDEDERVLLRRLSVFEGEFDLATVVAVASDARLPAQVVPHVLGGLVAKSMVLSTEPPCFRLLGATRAFAAIELAATGEQEHVKARLSARGTPRAVPVEEPRDPALTARQHEVLALVAAGRTNSEIAAELGIAERTVEHHIGHMLTRLGLRTRTQLAVWSRR